MSAGRMATDIYPVRIATVFGDVLHHPSERSCNIFDLGGVGMFGCQPIAWDDREDSILGESVSDWPVLTPISRAPGAAVNKEKHGRSFELFGDVDIQVLLRISVVALCD